MPYVIRGEHVLIRWWTWILASLSLSLFAQYLLVLGAPPFVDFWSIDLSHLTAAQRRWLVVGALRLDDLHWDALALFSTALFFPHVRRTEQKIEQKVNLLRRRKVAKHQTITHDNFSSSPYSFSASGLPAKEDSSDATIYTFAGLQAQCRDYLQKDVANAYADLPSSELQKVISVVATAGARMGFVLLLLADKVLLIFVLIAGTLHIDIFALGYLILALRLLFHSSDAFAWRRQWLWLRTFNLATLLAILVFQMPYISAPHVYKYEIKWSAVLGLNKLEGDEKKTVLAEWSMIIFALVAIEECISSSRWYGVVWEYYGMYHRQAMVNVQRAMLLEKNKQVARAVMVMDRRQQLQLKYDTLLARISQLMGSLPDEYVWSTVRLDEDKAALAGMENKMAEGSQTSAAAESSSVAEAVSGIAASLAAVKTDVAAADAPAASAKEPVKKAKDIYALSALEVPSSVYCGARLQSSSFLAILLRLRRVTFLPNERVLVACCNSSWLSRLLTNDETEACVLLTNFRIIKIAAGVVTDNIVRKQILDVAVQDNGKFRYSKLLFSLEAPQQPQAQIDAATTPTVDATDDKSKDGEQGGEFTHVDSIGIWSSSATAFFSAVLRAQLYGNEELDAYLPISLEKQSIFSPTRLLRRVHAALLSCVDPLLFAEIVRDGRAPILVLLWAVIASHTKWVVFFTFAASLFASPSLLSLPVPLLIVVFGISYTGRSPKLFWLFCLSYTALLITCKFLFQFKFFCIDTDFVYSLQPLGSCPEPSSGVGLEEDTGPPFRLGLYKNYYTTFARLVLGDMLCLLALAWHKHQLGARGFWDLQTEADCFDEEVEVDADGRLVAAIGNDWFDQDPHGEEEDGNVEEEATPVASEEASKVDSPKTEEVRDVERRNRSIALVDIKVQSPDTKMSDPDDEEDDDAVPSFGASDHVDADEEEALIEDRVVSDNRPVKPQNMMLVDYVAQEEQADQTDTYKVTSLFCLFSFF